jgi:tRNA-binding EMAP/Myf-like protein
MTTLSTKTESNYLAKIVKPSGVRKHSNADRLACMAVDGNNVITGIDIFDGLDDLYVYFPVGCEVNKDFLSYTNSFRDSTLNVNKEAKGFFDPKGIVKAVKLRGERSEGYLVSAKQVEIWFLSTGQNLIIPPDAVGTYFDTILGVTLCQKYTPPIPTRGDYPKGQSKKARENFIVQGQYHLTADTAHLGRCIHELNLNDYISITFKLHGCAISVGKVQCRRRLKWYERTLKRFGIKIDNREYDIVYASRRVIKGTFKNQLKRPSFYDSNVWLDNAKRLQDTISDNLIYYGEVVGYTSKGSPIQKMNGKAYDYGCQVGFSEVYIYRITFVGNDGKVYDMSWPQIKDHCERFGIKHVPELYYGTVSTLLNTLSNKYPTIGKDLNDDNWRDKLLELLREEYLEKKCTICKNDVWAEGIVVRKDKGFRPLKIKSFTFKLAESKNIEEETENMDDM